MNEAYIIINKIAHKLFMFGIAVLCVFALQVAPTHAQSTSDLLEIINRLLIQIQEAQTTPDAQSNSNGDHSDSSGQDKQDEEIDTKDDAETQEIGVGDTVRTTDRLSVRAIPGGSRVHVARAQSSARIIGGPRDYGDYTWWLLQYSQNDIIGWSAGNWLELESREDTTDNDTSTVEETPTVDGCYSGGYYYSEGAEVSSVRDREGNTRAVVDGVFVCQDDNEWYIDSPTPREDDAEFDRVGCYSDGNYYTPNSKLSQVITQDNTTRGASDGYFVCQDNGDWEIQGSLPADDSPVDSPKDSGDQDKLDPLPGGCIDFNGSTRFDNLVPEGTTTSSYRDASGQVHSIIDAEYVCDNGDWEIQSGNRSQSALMWSVLQELISR